MFRLAFKKILNSLSRGTIRLAGAWTSKQKEYNALKSCPIHCARERPLTLMIKWTNKSSFFVSTQPKNNQRENLQLDYLALLYQFESCVQLFQHLIREVYRWMVEVQSTLDRCQLTKRERHQQSTSRIGRFHFDKPLAKSWLWSRTPAVERTNRGSRWKNMSEKTNTILFDDILLTILNIILNKSSICNCYGSPRTSLPYSPLPPSPPPCLSISSTSAKSSYSVLLSVWTDERRDVCHRRHWRWRRHPCSAEARDVSLQCQWLTLCHGGRWSLCLSCAGMRCASATEARDVSVTTSPWHGGVLGLRTARSH